MEIAIAKVASAFTEELDRTRNGGSLQRVSAWSVGPSEAEDEMNVTADPYDEDARGGADSLAAVDETVEVGAPRCSDARECQISDQTSTTLAA
jgi:hypothetical protein